MKETKLMYFPNNIDEIDEYVENTLPTLLSGDCSTEKMLLHSILTMLFSTEELRNEASPRTVLHLLQTTAHENENGHTMLDELYLATSGQIHGFSAESVYWYIRHSDDFGRIVIRLMSVYQFYEKHFNEPVISSDGKRFLFYPSNKKNITYSVPKGVEEIASNAFIGNQNIQFIKIPDTVSKIGKMAKFFKMLITFGKNIKNRPFLLLK